MPLPITDSDGPGEAAMVAARLHQRQPWRPDCILTQSRFNEYGLRLLGLGSMLIAVTGGATAALIALAGIASSSHRR